MLDINELDANGEYILIVKFFDKCDVEQVIKMWN